MASKKNRTVNLAIVGTGTMGHFHAENYKKLRGIKLAACYDLNLERAEAFAAEFKIPAVYNDLSKLLKHPGLDGISNVTPDSAHAKIAIAAAKSGIHILSEKPLATDVDEGRTMLRAVRKAGIINMINFSYRDSSALQAAAARMARGYIGRVMHIEPGYLQSWLTQAAWGEWRTNPTWLWRLSKKHGSFGTLGDVGCHLYDATCFLAGPIKNLSCRLKTFPKGIKGNRIGEYRLDANDSFVTHAEFKNGALGVLHATRWASGWHNRLRFAIYGDEGGIEIDLANDYNTYRICRGKKNLETEKWETCNARKTPNMYKRFADAIRTGKEYSSDFENGLQVQKYLEYSQISDEKQQTVTIR
jgi:predicted dehydrogenase